MNQLKQFQFCYYFSDKHYSTSGLLCFIVNLARSINETANTIKIFWHESLCIEQPLPLIFWPLKNQCFYFMAANSVFMLGNNKLFYKGSTMCVWNSRSGRKHHSLLSPGIGDFTRFHLHKKWMPRSSLNGGRQGFPMTGALSDRIIHYLIIIFRLLWKVTLEVGKQPC